MKTELRPGESIVKEGAANLQRNVETVGGRLWLTSQRLIFESHRFNIQTGATVLELAAIASARPCWTKLLGLIPLVPNALAVTTGTGEEYRFVVFDRQGWAVAINNQ